MNLYLVSRKGACDYDQYSDAVVAAKTKKEAQLTHPSGRKGVNSWDKASWVRPEDVLVEYIGKAKRGTKAGVVCASFHAG